jgi:hypothetical protein
MHLCTYIPWRAPHLQSITAPRSAFIGDETAGCAPAFLSRNGVAQWRSAISKGSFRSIGALASRRNACGMKLRAPNGLDPLMIEGSKCHQWPRITGETSTGLRELRTIYRITAASRLSLFDCPWLPLLRSGHRVLYRARSPQIFFSSCCGLQGFHEQQPDPA